MNPLLLEEEETLLFVLDVVHCRVNDDVNDDEDCVFLRDDDDDGSALLETILTSFGL